MRRACRIRRQALLLAREGIKTHARQVRKLISGPGGIFICDECVELCNEIIAGHLPSSRSPSVEELPTERLLERLGAIEETVQGKGNQLQQAVDLLRSRRVSVSRVSSVNLLSSSTAAKRCGYVLVPS